MNEQLFLKLILFTVNHRRNAQKEICSHTNWTWGHIWEHCGTYSLASWSTGLTTDWFYSLPGGAGLFPFPYHYRPRKWFIGNLRISYLHGRDWLCCFRLHSCLARDEYWYLHTHGVTASHTHYWPRHYNYCLSFQLSIPVPAGTTSFGSNFDICEWTCPSLPLGYCTFSSITQSCSESVRIPMWVSSVTFSLVLS